VFTTVFNVGEAIEGYATLKRLADSPSHIVPGHDPLVMRRYRAPAPALAGIAVHLDMEPVDATEEANAAVAPAPHAAR
jgi:hypothetical protein